MATPAEARRYARNLRDLLSVAQRDLALLLDTYASQPRTARDRLLRALPAMASVYSDACGFLAADWYDEVRSSAGVSGGFSARPTAKSFLHRMEPLAVWAVGPLFSGSPDPLKALDRVYTGVERAVADIGRATVLESSVSDPQARGWERISPGGGCDYCAGLLGFYDWEADFETHAGCTCQAVPVFK